MGTAKQGKGRGQWCKSRLHIYVLLPQTVLPYVISVPPKSLKPVLNYFTYLSVKGLPAFGVVTSFKLTAEKNADNIKYSEIRPLKAKELTPEEAQVMREYHEAIKPYLTVITGSLIQEETRRIDPDTGEIEEQPF